MLVKAAYASCFIASLTLAAFSLLMALTALAQAPGSATTTATSSAPTTSEATSVATAPEPWFKIERISGGDIQLGDFVISPGKVELEVAAGQTVVRPINVTNRVSDGRKFELEIEDITGSEDGRQAVVLLGDDRGPYSLKDFISIPDDEFQIGLGERAVLPITISVPPDAEPGGYYGAVLVSTVQLDETEEAGQVVRQPVIARVGTLFFITVPGAVETEGELTDFSLIDDVWWYESGPINFGLVFENTGSKHLNPYGELEITNVFGEQVGFTELEPWFALPKSVRLRETTWNREFLLGRYVATARINRGYDDIVDERTVVFWVLPWKIVLGVFVAVFVVVFLIRAFFRTFEFKRKR